MSNMNVLVTGIAQSIPKPDTKCTLYAVSYIPYALDTAPHLTVEMCQLQTFTWNVIQV